jgi:hypothetical protein
MSALRDLAVKAAPAARTSAPVTLQRSCSRDEPGETGPIGRDQLVVAIRTGMIEQGRAA